MDARPQAALLLGAALVTLPLLHRPPEAAACEAPAELGALDGHTREASCAGGAPVRGPARLLLGQRLDPNTADAAALDVLPGIGPGRAAAIVAARCTRRFADAQELERVPGIGPLTRARLEAWLAVDPDASPVCASAQP